MNSVLHEIRAGWERAVLLAGRARARRELLRFSDRTLADSGFSRELLETGVGAWPWRFDDDSAAAAREMHAARARRAEERRAIDELEAYSDAELTDLGLARADIKRAVREGRVGVEIERADERQEAERRRAA